MEFSPPDGGYGWIIVIASIVINTSLAPLMQCFGIIYENKFQDMDMSAAEISFLLHLHNAIMCSLGFICGPLLKKYNFRQTSICGCLFVCCGITLTSFAQRYEYFLFTISFLIGTGQGILMPSTALAVNSYFKKRLTLAMSYSVTGVGLLPIITPQICNMLMNSYGIQGTVLILSAFSYNALLGALLLRPVAKPNVSSGQNNEKVLLPCSNKTVVVLVRDEKHRSKIRKLVGLLNLELFKERAYVIIIIGMGISYVAELNFALMTPFVLSELAGFTRADVALAMSIQAAADISGRLFIPIFSHARGISPKLMYAVSLVGSSFGRTVLTIICDTRYAVLSCSVLLGLSKGARAVFQSLILPKYVGLDKLASAMGFLMVINGVLSLPVGPMIGAVHDVSGSYTYALHTASGLSGFCIILWLLDEYAFGEKRFRTVQNDII